jgi:hypothetical protein
MSLSFFGSLEPGVSVPVGTLNSRRCWPLLSIVAAEVKGREREDFMKATIDDERSTWPLRVRGVACLPAVDLDIGSLNRIMVRDNDVVFGTVNANRWHYKMAADALARADKAWLGRLITRRVPLDRWSEALEHRHEDIKVVIDFVQ